MVDICYVVINEVVVFVMLVKKGICYFKIDNKNWILIVCKLLDLVFIWFIYRSCDED